MTKDILPGISDSKMALYAQRYHYSGLLKSGVNAIILNREFAAEMEKMFARDIAESDRIQWEEWGKRSLLLRIREWLAHLFVRWL